MVVPAFNQEKALVGAFSVITNLRVELFQALIQTLHSPTFSKLPPGYKFFSKLYSVCDPVTKIPTESEEDVGSNIITGVRCGRYEHFLCYRIVTLRINVSKHPLGFSLDYL